MESTRSDGKPITSRSSIMGSTGRHATMQLESWIATNLIGDDT